MSSCFWHGWNVMSCSIFSNLPIVILHQQRQLKMSGNHLGVWKGFPGKPLVGWYSAIFDGQSSWLWSQMHVSTDMRFPPQPLLLTPPAVPVMAPSSPQAMGNHGEQAGHMHVLTWAPSSPAACYSAPHPLSPVPKCRGVPGGRDWVRTCTHLPAWVSLRPLLMCWWLCPSIPGVREFVPVKMAEPFLQMSHHHMIHLLVSSHGDVAWVSSWQAFFGFLLLC